MKERFRLIRRGTRGDKLYCVDTKTGKRTSLQTSDEDSARQILHARNEAERQPMLNLQIAKAYLAGSDSEMAKRTWRDALHCVIETKRGANQERWRSVALDQALVPLLPKIIIETSGEAVLKTLRAGTVSTNVFLRRLHNFCLDMNWLLWPLVPKRQWPIVRYKDKRAITLEEHQRMVGAEENPERRAFYQLCWHLGGSQGDVAALQGEDVDWPNSTVSFVRRKTGVAVLVHLGTETLNLLADLPAEGMLFPKLGRVRASDRAAEFNHRAHRLGIKGITLHSYRYAWAERARTVGYPERFAQEALGHNSKAVHRAYAKRAHLKIPSLEEYEKRSSPTPGPGPAM